MKLSTSNLVSWILVYAADLLVDVRFSGAVVSASAITGKAHDSDAPLRRNAAKAFAEPISNVKQPHKRSSSYLDDLEEPKCWERGSVVGDPIMTDCYSALREFKADPFYDDNITYTRVASRVGHNADRQVPLHWHHQTCVLYVGAMPLSVDWKFSLQSIYPAVSRLFTECLIKPKPGFKNGGVIWIHHQLFGRGFLVCAGPEPKEGCDFNLVGSATRWNETI